MISKQEVQHIAKLARLGLSARETAKMQKELASILDYIDLLSQADVSKVEAVSRTAPIENVMRQDKAQPEQRQVVAKLLEQAPDKQGEYVKVKAIL